jgi:hypothetical protein
LEPKLEFEKKKKKKKIEKNLEPKLEFENYFFLRKKILNQNWNLKK